MEVVDVSIGCEYIGSKDVPKDMEFFLYVNLNRVGELDRIVPIEIKKE